MPKPSNYTLLIICEGHNTEPHFFNSIRDRIIDKKFEVGDIRITIRPEPLESTSVKSESELKPRRRPRDLRPAKSNVENEIPGVPPLKWVLAGQRELQQGTFDEVWVVFDNDNHPARAEAFQSAQNLVNGKRVQIAYSSIAFEYYLLLHFERINKAFIKSECRIDDKIIYCSRDKHEKDCLGKLCVGGYARRKGYWDESKEKTSLFPLVENKLENGFWNAAWLRYVSEARDAAVPIYDRNPYVTTDNIVRRLTGYSDHSFIVVPFEYVLNVDDTLEISFQRDLRLRITNVSNIGVIVPANSIGKVPFVSGNEVKIGERSVLNPTETSYLPFATAMTDLGEFNYYFAYELLKVMLIAE